jgi:hypothetical protein
MYDLIRIVTERELELTDMPKLTKVKLDDYTEIYIEATEDVDVPLDSRVPTGEVQRTAKGVTITAPSFQMIENTIRSYTSHTLNAFREMAIAEVKKVTLEFGVNISGMGGVPYIATGTAGCNIKITVECAFPDTKVQPER